MDWFSVVEKGVEIYEAAALQVRFVYTYWIILIALYIFMGQYERMHNLVPKREYCSANWPFAVHVPTWSALLLYNIGVNLNVPASFNIKPDGLRNALGVVGFLLLSCGLVFAVWGRLSLNGRWANHIYKYQIEDGLVTDFAYKYVRHPIYWGQSTMAVGSVLVGQSYWLLHLPVLVILLNVIRAKNEEMDLEERFGETFRRYREQTPALFPWRRGG